MCAVPNPMNPQDSRERNIERERERVNYLLKEWEGE